jgi:hypothetical protein
LGVSPISDYHRDTEAFGGVGELEALARALVELVGDGVELGLGLHTSRR